MHISRRRFEELVAEAMDAIPEELAALVENCAVVVEDWPSADQVRAAGQPESETLFGLYEGVALTERSPLTYSGVMPDRITVFMGPHVEVARDEDELFDEILTTIVHEIAHHFGISDERLHELGWD